jgi:hypothetical protein
MPEREREWERERERECIKNTEKLLVNAYSDAR